MTEIISLAICIISGIFLYRNIKTFINDFNKPTSLLGKIINVVAILALIFSLVFCGIQFISGIIE